MGAKLNIVVVPSDWLSGLLSAMGLMVLEKELGPMGGPTAVS